MDEELYVKRIVEGTENLFTPNKIRTYSGLYVDPLDPDPEVITIGDIAHALSMECRWNGHAQRFISVAEHSLNVVQYIRERHPDNFSLQLQALMHDASEAYLKDLPSPVKDRIPGYRQAQDHLMEIIAEKFCFAFPFNPIVKEADKFNLKYEWCTLVLPCYGTVLHPEPIRKIKAEFLRTFDKLTNSITHISKSHEADTISPVIRQRAQVDA